MLRTTLSTTWSRKRRLVGTALAIVLGVAFLSATLVLGDSARAGFTTAFTEANAGTDAVVRSSIALTGDEMTQRPPIDAAVLDAVRSLDGVAVAEPTVEGLAQVLDAEGDPIGGNGPPTLGASWVADPGLSAWNLVEGAAPAAAGEVVLDRGTATKAGVGVGDPVTVLVPDPVQLAVSGIATFADGSDSIGGTTYAFFTLDEAQRRLLGRPDAISGVVVAAADGVSEAELVSRLGSVLPAGTEAITAQELTREQQEEIEGDFLGFFTAALLVFAFVALLVAAFSIFNTFSILVAQRTRESALLRALGASRRQVLTAALVESTLVGLIGSVLGALAGVAIAAGMLAAMGAADFGLPNDGLQVAVGTMAVAVVAGMAVTLVGGVGPAWRSSRVAPLAALREVSVDSSGSSRLRAGLGVLATVAGAALVLVASGDEGIELTGLGAAVLVLGVVLLGPITARPVGRLLGVPLSLRGLSGRLAARNAVRNPRRTAATSTALLVGVGVVTLFTVLAASLSDSFEESIDRGFAGDLVLSPVGSGWSGAGLDTAAAVELRALPEVESAAGLGYGAAVVDGRQEGVGFADPAELARVADLDVVEGDLSAVGGGEIAVSEAYADDHGLAVGDAVTIEFLDGATEALTVAVTFDAESIGGEVLLPLEVWARHNAQPSYFLVAVGLADGVSVDEGRAVVTAAGVAGGTADVMDRDEFIDSQLAEVDVLLTVIYALLAVAILIALMGIANTLSLSVHERTRELGLLRAVGQTRSELRAMVRWESVIVATFGSLMGLGSGLFLGWGLVRALGGADEGIAVSVPTGSLLVVLVVGAAVGIVAALRPAWRASRLDVLQALAAD